MTKDEVRIHLEYAAWTAAKLLAAAAALPPGEVDRERGVSHHSIEETLSHMYQGDRVWLSRLIGGPPYLLRSSDEPRLPLADLERDWPAVQAKWLDWAESVEDFGTLCSYRTMKGDPLTTPFCQIVMHRVNHVSIHAGQVTALLRQAGVVPPQVDLIAFYRSLEQK